MSLDLLKICIGPYHAAHTRRRIKQWLVVGNWQYEKRTLADEDELGRDSHVLALRTILSDVLALVLEALGGASVNV